MLRRLTLFLFVLAAVTAVLPAAAQEINAEAVVVADVRGPLDQRALDFLVDAVHTDDAQLVVLKIDNPGIASGDQTELVRAIEVSATPVVAWVGPEGAVAYGEVAKLLDHMHVVGGAPGARIGYSDPDTEFAVNYAGLNTEYGEFRDVEVIVGETLSGPIADEMVVQPTIGQFIAALDGMDIETSLGNVRVETATETTLEDGSTAVIISSVDVRFLKPTLLTRFLRLGARPDAAFFFLVAGLAIGAFEFYAAGGGVAGAMAALSLFLAGYGFATLPMNWLAVAAVVVGVGLYTWDFQRHELGIRSIVGTILLLGGGLIFVGGPPQIATTVWSVLLTVVGVMLFYLFAMTTIVRSRFGTPTIGREHLVGATGVAESALEPDGVVNIEGAKWRARAHRAAGIERGSAIKVLAVEGTTLQVAPPAE